MGLIQQERLALLVAAVFTPGLSKKTPIERICLRFLCVYVAACEFQIGNFGWVWSAETESVPLVS
jgi:hypothetical protein